MGMGTKSKSATGLGRYNGFRNSLNSSACLPYYLLIVHDDRAKNGVPAKSYYNSMLQKAVADRAPVWAARYYATVKTLEHYEYREAADSMVAFMREELRFAWHYKDGVKIDWK